MATRTKDEDVKSDVNEDEEDVAMVTFTMSGPSQLIFSLYLSSLPQKVLSRVG